MHTLFKLALFATLTLCLFASVSAAPIGVAGASELVARGGNKRTGWATYYNVEAGTGACGWNNKNSQHVAAIGGVTKSICGKTATVTYNHKTVKVKIVDECPVCRNNNIDLSPSAFEELAPKSKGKLNGIVWEYN